MAEQQYFVDLKYIDNHARVWIPEESMVEEHEYGGIKFITHYMVPGNFAEMRSTEPVTGLRMCRGAVEREALVLMTKDFIDLFGPNKINETIEDAKKTIDEVEIITLDDFKKIRGHW